MATVPTLAIRGNDVTGDVQHKTLYWKQKSLDFTLVDSSLTPQLHDSVSVDVPEWHGRVSTIEAHPFRSANQDDHHYVMVTCTNKTALVDDTAPFGLSDTPNMSTTFPYKDLTVIRTLADQTDLASAEHRLTATVYEPGLVPGMTVEVTNVEEGLSATEYVITEMQVTWLMDDSPVYYIEASVEGLPPPDLGDVISSQGCDCEPFVPCVPDYTVKSFANEENMACVFSEHANGQGCNSERDDTSAMMYVYYGATYRIDYLVYHAPGPMGSNGLWATLGHGAGELGSRQSPAVAGEGNTPMVFMGDARGPDGCSFDPVSDIPAASIEWTADFTGYVYTILTEGSCTSGDSYASSISTTITWLEGPDPRFEDLGLCEGIVPHSGQRLPAFTASGDGSNDTLTLDYPYMSGTIEVFVEGVDWTNLVTETDPDAGEFAVAYPYPLVSDSAGPNVFVHYRYP